MTKMKGNAAPQNAAAKGLIKTFDGFQRSSKNLYRDLGAALVAALKHCNTYNDPSVVVKGLRTVEAVLPMSHKDARGRVLAAARHYTGHGFSGKGATISAGKRQRDPVPVPSDLNIWEFDTPELAEKRAKSAQSRAEKKIASEKKKIAESTEIAELRASARPIEEIIRDASDASLKKWATLIEVELLTRQVSVSAAQAHAKKRADAVVRSRAKRAATVAASPTPFLDDHPEVLANVA